MPDATAPHLSVQLRHRVGALAIDVDFKLTQPWTILFGPSGSGKSTILRAVCGLIRPDEAKIVVTRYREPRTVTDTAAHLQVPPHRRPTRLVAQGSTLFPHMTAKENIAFGARMTSDGTMPAEFVAMTLEQFHLTHLAEKMPLTLSGGERQRVAIARAAVAAYSLMEGGILVLDEPFTGLDVPLRDELIVDLHSMFEIVKVPVLSVTHDIAEAFQLNAEVIKLSNGRIIHQGPAAVVLAEERTRLLAQLNPTSPHR